MKVGERMFVIIRGPLGAGKTTVARKLAEKLKGKHVSVDQLLEKKGLDRIEGECIPAKNFIKAIEGEVFEGTLVFDGNFYHKEQIEDLKMRLGGSCKIFTLKASLETCIERDKSRKRVYGEDAARAVHHLVSRFDEGIVIDTENKTADQIVEEIFCHITK